MENILKHNSLSKGIVEMAKSESRIIKAKNERAGSAVQHTFPYLYLDNLFLRCCSFLCFSFYVVKIDLGKVFGKIA